MESIHLLGKSQLYIVHVDVIPKIPQIPLFLELDGTLILFGNIVMNKMIYI
jgi:hypothetical protein